MKRGAMRAAELRRVAASVLLGAALGTGANITRAEAIDLLWRDGRHFERSLTIAPGKFAEICGPLAAGQTIEWSFKADHALNFNIHYHADKDVRFPAKQDQTASLQGILAVDAQQDHCWMWVNKATTAARLTLALTRK